MAREALVLDASVGVKWFSRQDESDLERALDIRSAHLSGRTSVLVPDLFYHEVTNAIAHKHFFSVQALQRAVSSLFRLSLQTVPVQASLLASAVEISRRHNITIYDAAYVAVATQEGCPLVTANPRHQGRALGCEVIPISEWKG